MLQQHEKITLKNGVRILYEKIPYVRSASVGLWVMNGSRHETARQNGISHFIEHMVFKGTQTRSAAALAAEMDRIGGQVNAFTSKEMTCFHARVLDSHMSTAMDILCDMFFHPRFAPKDLETEKSVVLEEIGMYEDTPEDKVTEMLLSEAFRDSPLGMPVLGTVSNVRRFTVTAVRSYMSLNYRPQDTVVALSGSFSDEDVRALAERFEQMEARPGAVSVPAVYTPGFRVRHKAIEQNHLCLGFPSVSLLSERRYAFQLLNNILGGGMSSRLFQSVREEKGLCYSIYSFACQHIDTGILGIYTALGKETELQALQLIRQEIEKLLQDGVTADELDRAREQLKAGFLMNLESTNTRMGRLARGELFYGGVMPLEELIQRYDAVTAEEVLSLARSIMGDSRMLSFTAVGKVESAARYRQTLAG